MASAISAAEIKTFPASLQKARQLAEYWHGAQKYGDEPYMVHLDEVVSVLADFQCGPVDVLEAGYLHDVLEDTDITFDWLVEQFNPLTATLVWAVSVPKPSSAVINDAAERKATCYERLQRVGSRAALVKLADRIANVNRSLQLWPINRDRAQTFLTRYREDYPILARAIQPLLPESQKLRLMAQTLDALMVLTGKPEAAYTSHLQKKFGLAKTPS